MTALHYDPQRRRLWIAGQRCHHGATGAVISTAATAVLLATRAHLAGLGAVLAAGGVLMAHDWHDRGVWFQAGHQQDA